MSRGTGIDALALAFIANLLIVVTVVCSASLAAARCLYHRNPSARHFVCIAGIVGVLLAPAIVLAVSSTGYGFEALHLTHTTAAPQTSHFYLTAAKGMHVYRLASPTTPYSRHAPPDPMPSLFFRWILSVWLAGSVWGAVRLGHGLRQAALYRRMAQTVDPQRLSEALSALEPANQISFPPIFTSQSARTPIAAGIVNPAVILPERLLETLSPIQLRHILAHELTHIRFKHGISGFAQRLAGLLFWPHPLVRALCSALSTAREEICDNVASQDDGAACYARTLLAVAEQIRFAPNLSSGLAFLGPGTSLEDRIGGLLDPRRIKQVELEPTKIWAVTGALVLTIAGSTAIRVVSTDRPQEANTVVLNTGAHGAATVSPDGAPVSQSADAYVPNLSGRRFAPSDMGRNKTISGAARLLDSGYATNTFGQTRGAQTSVKGDTLFTRLDGSAQLESLRSADSERIQRPKIDLDSGELGDRVALDMVAADDSASPVRFSVMKLNDLTGEGLVTLDVPVSVTYTSGDAVEKLLIGGGGEGEGYKIDGGIDTGSDNYQPYEESAIDNVKLMQDSKMQLSQVRGDQVTVVYALQSSGVRAGQSGSTQGDQIRRWKVPSLTYPHETGCSSIG